MAPLQRPLRPVRAVGRLSLAAALALALAGCSKGTKSEAPRPATPQPVTTVAQAPKPAKPVTHHVVIATKKRLVASLLTPADVGLGWRIAKKTSSTNPQHFCNRELVGLKPFARTDAVFKRGKGGGFVAQRMSAYPGAQAQSVIAAVQDLVRTCSGWAHSEKGITTSYTLAPLEFPSVGDETVAARLNASFSFRQKPVTLTTDFVMLREGNVVVYLSRTAAVGQQPPAGQLAALAQTAAGRLTAAG